MSELNTTLAVVGALVLFIGLLSEPLKRSFLSGPMLALAAGVLLGAGASSGFSTPPGGADKR